MATLTTKASLRTRTTAPSTGTIWLVTDVGEESWWRYDPLDKKSPDDHYNVLVDIKGRRYKRINFKPVNIGIALTPIPDSPSTELTSTTTTTSLFAPSSTTTTTLLPSTTTTTTSFLTTTTTSTLAPITTTTTLAPTTTTTTLAPVTTTTTTTVGSTTTSTTLVGQTTTTSTTSTTTAGASTTTTTFDYNNDDDMALYSAIRLNLLPGTDITSELNAICAAKEYSTVLFDAEGNYTLSGPVNANGVVFEFKKGNKLIGTSTISNVTIDAGDFPIMTTGITLTNAKATGPYFWWSWYGAQPDQDDSIDQAPFLQKGIDTVIANPTLPRDFHGGSGYWHTRSPLIVYKWNASAGDYQFCDIVVSGEPSTWKTSEEYGTWIWNHNPQSFVIGFQKVRSSSLLNVQLRGEAKYEDKYGGYGALFGANLANYTADYNTTEGKNILDGRFAMHAGVVVDPFANGPLYNETWPGLESWNRGIGTTGGSSAVHIEGVYLMYLTVGIMLSPTGMTFNAEDMSMERIFFRSNKIGLSIGQTQNKNIQLKNFVAYATHTVIDGLTHGSQAGAQVVAENGDMSNCHQLVNISSQRFPWVFKNMFTEEFHKIGYIDHGAQPVIFENCQFEIVGNSERVASMPAYILEGNNVKFIGGYVRTPHAPTFTRLAFKGSAVTFDQCTLETPPLFTGTVETSNGDVNGSFKMCHLLAWESKLGAQSANSQNFAPFRNYPLYGQFSLSSQMIYNNAFVKSTYDQTKYDYSFRLGGADVTNIDPEMGTATITLQNLGVYPVTGLDVNDYIIGQVGANIQPIGRITAINYSTGVTSLTDVPLNITAGNYIIWGNYVRKTQLPFAGNITNGSPTITNIQAPFGYPSVGDRVEYHVDMATYSSVPMFITAINQGAGTATLSRNAIGTATGVVFAMGEPEIEITSMLPYTDANFPSIYLLKGTELQVKNGDRYRVVVGGTKTTATIVQI